MDGAVAVDGGIGPILGTVGQPMFHRIDPAIADCGAFVRIAAEVLLPEPTLPDPMLAPGLVAGAAGPRGHGTGKPGFDHAPPGREIVVILGQGPDTMHMVGQDNPSLDREGPLGLGASHGGAQGRDFAGEQL